MATIAQLKAEVSVTGVEASTSKLGAFGAAVEKTGKMSGDATPKLMSHEKAMSTLGTGAMVGGGLLVAGFGLAVGAAAGFDKAMSGVAAVSDASAGQLDKLRAAALEAGKATVFSASEAAGAQAELAKAGVSTADILGGALRGSLDLAAAGQIDVAESATIAAQAMNVFKLSGSDVGRVADVLAAGANKSAADVSQLGQALQQGGLMARQTGLSLEETVGALAAFADNALIGSDAGTSLKSMLQRLTPQSKEAKDLMQDLGISAYDAGGQFIGLDKFAGNLKGSLKNLTPEQRNSAMATIFGSDAVRAANILYDEGEKGIRKYTAAVNDQGAAGRMAGKQLDNLSGDFEALRGSIETALITGGGGATSALRFLTQAATGTVNAIADLPGPLQATAVGFAGVGGASLFVVGAVGAMVPKVQEGVKAFRSLRDWMNNATGASKALAVGLKTAGAAAAGFAVYKLVTGYFDDMTDSAKKFAAETMKGHNLRSLEGLIGAQKSLSAEMEKQIKIRERATQGDDSFINKGMTGLRDAVRDLAGMDTSGMVQSGKKIEELTKKMERVGLILRKVGTIRSEVTELVGPGFFANGEQAVTAIDAVATSLGINLTSKGKLSRDESEKVAAALVGQTSAAYGAAGSLDAIGRAAGDGAKEIDDFKKSMDSLLGVHLDATAAEIQYRDSLVSLTESVKENGLTFDLNTDAGRRNTEAFIASTRAAEEHAIAIGKTSAGIAGAELVMQSEIATLGETAKAFGMTDQEALNYMMDLYGIPADVRTNITSTADLARLLVQGLNLDLDNLNGKTANTYVNTYATRWLETVNKTPAWNDWNGWGGNASGGRIGSGNNWTMVGEQGKELVRLPTGSQVYSNVESNRMIRDGATSSQSAPVTYITQEFTVPPNVNMIELGRVTRRALDAYDRVSVG